MVVGWPALQSWFVAAVEFWVAENVFSHIFGIFCGGETNKLKWHVFFPFCCSQINETVDVSQQELANTAWAFAKLLGFTKFEVCYAV